MRRIPLGKSFGVMQGRLSNQTTRGYQAFPSETWQLEFDEAQRRGFEHIEWIVDSFSPEENPLLRAPEQVRKITESTGVSVKSLCADFLMDNPLFPSGNSWRIFRDLISVSLDLEIEVIVIPAVDQSSARNPENLVRLKSALNALSQEVGNLCPSIALETDLAPKEFLTLVNEIAWESLSINYDSGNSASLGFVAESELSSYGHLISDIHIKDRLFAGPSVPLGEGAANLDLVLEFAHEFYFSGLVTMQAFRDVEGLAVLDKQLDFLEAAIVSRGKHVT